MYFVLDGELYVIIKDKNEINKKDTIQGHFLSEEIKQKIKE